MEKWSKILAISSYGFIIAISSMLFFYIGYLIDDFFGTSPSFMLGLFLLSIFLVIGKLFKEVLKQKNKEN